MVASCYERRSGLATLPYQVHRVFGDIVTNRLSVAYGHEVHSVTGLSAQESQAIHYTLDVQPKYDKKCN